MRKTLKVAAREYKSAVRTKAFLVSVVLMPFLMGGGLLAMMLLKDRVDTRDQRVAVVDRSGILAPALADAAEARNAEAVFDPETGKKIKPAYLFEAVAPDSADRDGQRLALSDSVRARELHAFLEVGPAVLDPSGDPDEAYLKYYSDNAALDELKGWVNSAANNHLRKLRLAALNIDAAAADRLMAWTDVQALSLVEMDAKTGRVTEAERANEALALFMPLGFIMVMFMLVLMGSTPLVNAVLEEKMQRIAEVMLGSVRPFEMMMGKLLGSLGVSFTIVLVYLAGALFVAWRQNALHAVPMDLLPWFFAYQAGAVMLFGALFAAVGAAASDIKEAQSLMMPVMLLVVWPMFIWVPVLQQPLSGLATWTSLWPSATPFLMLVRQASPVAVPAWQPWVGLTGLILASVLVVWAGGRVFRIGLLMQGKAPRPAELLRWVMRG
jgi:ABC-2 type transport system permease protein